MIKPNLTWRMPNVNSPVTKNFERHHMRRTKLALRIHIDIPTPGFSTSMTSSMELKRLLKKSLSLHIEIYLP